MRTKNLLLLFAILTLAALFRFTGIQWDDNTHLHPDERFLTMVATNISWPTDIREYFDTGTSPLNPHNKDFTFYVYGTYPIYLTKLVAQLIRQDTYDGLTLVGRVLSGIADLFTLLFVFLITKHLIARSNEVTNKQNDAPYIAAFLYAAMVLPIQLSHFFTVDPYLTLFLTIALYRLVKGRIDTGLGISLGLAAAAKISGILLLPLVGVVFLVTWPWKRTPGVWKKRWNFLLHGILCFIAFAVTLRIFYPYLFDGLTLNHLVLENWKQLKSFDSPTAMFPPSLQWIDVPFRQPFLDMIVWGLGIPLGILSVISLIYFGCMVVQRMITRPQKPSFSTFGILIILFWTLFVYFYQSLQFAKAMRYLWPMYPSMAILSGLFLSHIWNALLKRFRFGQWINTLFCLLVLLWPLSFISIYQTPHTRILATQWIYAHIPHGSTIAWEHWDDPLPFALGGNSPQSYTQIELPSFDPDDLNKPQKISNALSKADYLILSSNRGYGALTRNPLRHPHMNAFYRQLFSGEQNFRLVAGFTSRPTLALLMLPICIHIPGFSYGEISRSLEECMSPGITFVDDYVDETFTVYDHPKVLIFQKK